MKTAFMFLFFVMPATVSAQTISATGDTLENTESKIRLLTQKEGGKSYKIIAARMGNKVHMTAEIIAK